MFIILNVKFTVQRLRSGVSSFSKQNNNGNKSYSPCMHLHKYIRLILQPRATFRVVLQVKIQWKLRRKFTPNPNPNPNPNP